jgi:hypothetical protein
MKARAAFEAMDNVSILLCGNRQVFAFQLRRSLTNAVPFQRCYRDLFFVELDHQLETIEYIALEHNNENSAPAWFVESVLVQLTDHQREFLSV